MDWVGGATYVDHTNAYISDGGAQLAPASTGTWMAHVTHETLLVKVLPGVAAADVAPHEGTSARYTGSRSAASCPA